jgi:hypothetical protein
MRMVEDRVCLVCNKSFFRRKTESITSFNQRDSCGIVCGRKLATQSSPQVSLEAALQLQIIVLGWHTREAAWKG